jgi:hypothetical protein
MGLRKAWLLAREQQPVRDIVSVGAGTWDPGNIFLGLPLCNMQFSDSLRHDSVDRVS